MDARLNRLKPTVYIETVPELARERAEAAEAPQVEAWPGPGEVEPRSVERPLCR